MTGERRTALRDGLILLVFCGLLFFRELGGRELWASHEARAAQNAQRILDDGNWLLPRLYDDQIELQKPPGFYWLVALVGLVRGEVDAWAVRLPSAVAGTLTVLLVWWHLRRQGRPVAGLLVGCTLACAVHFAGTARIGRIDVPLACVVTAIMLLGNVAFRGAKGRTPGNTAEGLSEGEPTFRGARVDAARTALLGLLGAIALLLKGPIGLVIPCAALGVWVLVERVPLRRPLLVALGALAISLALGLPWFFWANHATDGEFYRVFVLYHHFNRAFGGAETLAGHPWWFYIPRLSADFLPATPILVLAIWQCRWRNDPEARFGLVWLAVMFVVLSMSRFKRADYLLPAYPGAAILVGCAMEHWFVSRTPRTRRRLAWAFAIGLCLVPIGWFAFDRLVTDKREAAFEQAPFARRIREFAPAPKSVVLFRVELHLLAYHLGRPVHTLVEWDDLAARLREPGPHFVVTRAEFLDECRARIGAIELLARSEDVARVPPQRPLVLLRITGPKDTWPNPKD